MRNVTYIISVLLISAVALYIGCDGGGGNGDESCSSICDWRTCGSFDGCDCGSCPGGYQCVNYQCEELPCEGSCSGKECGVDECGDSCGTCDGGLVCNAGDCVDPDTCTDTCGSSGCDCGTTCGSDCGTCSDGWSCVDECNCECSPQCAGKECGDDNCGGDCGMCSGGETCQAGECVPSGTGDDCDHITGYTGEWSDMALAEDGDWNTAASVSQANKILNAEHPYNDGGDRYWKVKYSKGSGGQWVGFSCYSYDSADWVGVFTLDDSTPIDTPTTYTEQIPGGCLELGKSIQLRVSSSYGNSYYEGEILCL